jgi:ligand-binding sensor domain-containing protein
MQLVLPLHKLVSDQRIERITHIHEDHKGMIWLGISNIKLVKLNPGTLETKLIPLLKDPQSAAWPINCMLQEDSTVIWIGTDMGLLKFDLLNEKPVDIFNPEHEEFYYAGKKKENDDFDFTNIIPERYPVRSFLPDRESGGLWVGTEYGFYFFNTSNNQFTSYMPENTPAWPNLGMRMCMDSEDLIWTPLETWIYLFDPVTHSFDPVYKEIDNRPEGNWPIPLQDPIDPNRMWILYGGRGIMILDKKTMKGKMILDENDPVKISATNMSRAFDKQGNLWLGTSSDGILVVRNDDNPCHYIEQLTKRSGFHNLGYMLRNMDITPDNRIWVGGGGFVAHYDIKNKILNPVEDWFWSQPCFMKGGIHFLNVDSDGDIWIQSSTCLYKWDPQTNENSVYEVGQDYIYTLQEDSLGFVWINQASGPVRLDPRTGEYVVYNRENGSDVDFFRSYSGVESSLKNDQGEIWFNNRYNLVRLEGIVDKNPDDVHLDNYKFAYVIPPELLEDKIGEEKDYFTSANCIDANVHYDPDQQSVNYITKKDGLADDMVLLLEVDHQNRIWAGCNYGLSCLDPATSEIFNFDQSDDLISAVFKYVIPFVSGSAIDKDGHIYMGHSKGVLYFNPDEVLALYQNKPKLFFSSISINHNNVIPSKEGPIQRDISFLPDINLTYKDKVITFEYGIPDDLNFNYRYQYWYQLVGFDDDWVDAGKNTTITYSSLPQGDYKLMLNASSTNKFLDDTIVALSIHMAPPPWATWWAYTMYVMFSLGAIWGFVAWRTNEQPIHPMNCVRHCRGLSGLLNL